MSFIDYNFFPILFFLGWNILTTKQFRPTIGHTSDYKTLPALSVFSLTNSINKKTLESNSKNYQKESNILEFVPQFLCLSENQKLIIIPQANLICSEKQTKNTSVLKKTDRKTGTSNINYVAKPTKWLPNEEIKHYLANHNLLNNNWEENFKSNFFNFTYRPQPKQFLFSFFSRAATPYNQRIQPIYPFMESCLNLRSFERGSKFSDMLLNTNSFGLLKSSRRFNNNIFFGGLCYSENNTSFLKKTQKILKLQFVSLRPNTFSQTHSSFKKSPHETTFFNDFKKGLNGLFCFKDQTKNPSMFKQDTVKHEIPFTKTQKTAVSEKKNMFILSGRYNNYNSFFHDSSFLKIKTGTKNYLNGKLNNLNSIQKRRLKLRILLRVPSQKIYSLNQFQMALCSSKTLQPSIFFHDNYRFSLAVLFSNLFENKNTSKLKISNNSEFPKLDSFMLNCVKNEFSQKRSRPLAGRGFSKTKLDHHFVPQDNRFTNSNKDLSYVDNYKQKKNWYMKTQLFQHIAWNMRHKILNRFLDVEYLLYTQIPDDFVTKPFQLVSYKNKDDFSTNSNKSLRIATKQFKVMPSINKVPVSNQTKNNNIAMNSENINSTWLNNFSEKFKKNLPLKAHTFCQNYFLSIYAGSWYYENLAFPYSIFNNITLSSSVNTQFETISSRLQPLLNDWSKAPFKEVAINQKSITNYLPLNRTLASSLAPLGKEKLLESKRFALAWFYVRKYNQLQNFRYWPYPNEHTYSNLVATKNQTQFQVASRENTYNPPLSQNSYFAKLQTKFESNPGSLSSVGIYSLAHKLSSVGFRNGNSEIDIYPFKYNDSYRYNFQNMNLLNIIPPLVFKTNGGIGFSDSLDLSRKSNNREKNNFQTSKQIFEAEAGCKKFLDFQNPVFSKIYAPIYQPKGLDLLSFIANSFLNIIPNSNINSQPKTFFGSFRKKVETTSFFSLNKTQPIINKYSYNFKKSYKPLKIIPLINENFHATPKKLTRLNGLYDKLPINGIHANPYPWITQNAFDRWSTENCLWNFVSDSSFLGSFSETKSNYPQINNLLKKKFIPTTRFNDSDKLSTFFNNRSFKDPLTTNIDNFQSKRSVDTESLMASPKKSLNNFNSRLHFTKKLSCIKKPSIFFSSFRHLPYFFISETLSQKNVIFPQANLSLFPTMGRESVINSSNYKSEKLTKNASRNLSIPEYSLFQSTIFKENQKKPITKFPPSPYFLQYKYFNLKPLSTFIKKEIGYNPSLFSNISDKKIDCSENQTKNTFLVKKPILMPQRSNTSLFSDNQNRNALFVFPYEKTKKTKKKILAKLWFWSKNKEKSIQKINFIPLKKNTWKVFPPLFQPLTFRFNNLNLPRTWSSELVSSVFRRKPLNTKHLKLSNPLENIEIEKKSLESSSSPLLPLTPHKGLKKKAYVHRVLGRLLNRDGEPFDKTRWPKDRIENNVFTSRGAISEIFPQTTKWNIAQKNFFGFSIPFYFSDFFRFSINENPPSNTNSALVINNHQNQLSAHTKFYESAFPLTEFSSLSDTTGVDDYKQTNLVSLRNNNSKLVSPLRSEKKNNALIFNETPKFQNSKITVYREKPLLKNRTTHGPPLKNQKESISLPSYLKNITNQNYQNLCPNNLNELYFVFWILFNKTLFIYLSLYYLRKFISFLGTEYIRNLFKIFVTMKFIDGNILSIIKTFQDFNFQLNQQNIIDIKVNKQLKNIKRN